MGTRTIKIFECEEFKDEGGEIILRGKILRAR
jgi:hypothetical protein